MEIKGADIPDGAWVDMIKEPIDNPTEAESILIADKLFSFKKNPNANNFAFSVELNQSAGKSKEGPWNATQMERILYFYDADGGGERLKKVQAFDRDKFDYSYPKIDQFSTDGRYVTVKMFGCWGCGGHMPETLLLDTQMPKTKNIGRVSFFEWQTDGNYGYKDYVVIECSEPVPGECSQDPATLPLKTGAM